MIERRELIFGMVSLLAFARARGALAAGDDVRRILARASALGERMSGVEWQQEIERLLIGADVSAIAKAVDLEALLRTSPRVEKGARVVNVPAAPWLPARPKGAV